MKANLNRFYLPLLFLLFIPFTSLAQGTERALEALGMFIMGVGIALGLALLIVVLLIITRKKWLAYCGYTLGSLSIVFGGFILYQYSQEYYRDEITDLVSSAFIVVGAFYLIIIFLISKLLPPKTNARAASEEPIPDQNAQNLIYIISGVLWLYFIYSLFSVVDIFGFFKLGGVTAATIVFLLLSLIPLIHLVVALVLFMRQSFYGWLLVQIFVFSLALANLLVFPLRAFVFQRQLYSNVSPAFYIQTFVSAVIMLLLIWLLLRPKLKSVFRVDAYKIKLALLIAVAYLALQILAGILVSN